MLEKKLKKGIAMIELIFALVIMGIVLMSAPMLIQQSIQSSNVALQQESIAAIAVHTGMLLSKPWDENNTRHVAGVSPILTVPTLGGGVSPFNLAGVDFDRNVSGRTSSVAAEEFNVSVGLGQEDARLNDLDDYNDFQVTLNVFNSEDATLDTLGDYVDKQITIATNVSYANDRPVAFMGTNIDASNNIFDGQALTAGTQSHIKFIQTTLTTNTDVEDLNKTIVLQAFSCNLGTYSLGGAEYR